MEAESRPSVFPKLTLAFYSILDPRERRKPEEEARTANPNASGVIEPKPSRQTGSRPSPLADLEDALTFSFLSLLCRVLLLARRRQWWWWWNPSPLLVRRRHRRPTMLWLARLSGLFSAAFLLLLLSPSLPSFPPAEAIRSLPLPSSSFRTAPPFRNSPACLAFPPSASSPCHPHLVHVALTLDLAYLRGSIAAVHSILQHASCPDHIFFHFLSDPSSSPILEPLVRSAFPHHPRFKFYPFQPDRVRGLISSSVRHALEQPLNYARNYLADVLDPCVRRVIYLDSDLVVVDDVTKLWRTSLGSQTVGAPEYCHANFTKYFTPRFWSDPSLAGAFAGRRPCYFNTGVMVIDLVRWRRFNYTRMIERWMEIQKSGGESGRIYELGSLPPFLLVFAGNIAPIEHRWNQHGLGGDNVKGSCRDLHPGPVSLLHWSGSGKPWARLDSRRPCPLDALWAPFDLYVPQAGR